MTHFHIIPPPHSPKRSLIPAFSRYKLFFCATCAANLFFSALWADEQGLKSKKLDAIVTSATGFDLPLVDESKNILLIEKDDLENKGYQSLEQALQYQPLITFSNSGFGQNIDLRGQGADANRAVKILLNRVPISLLDTSHGVPPYSNIDIEDIQSIEVIPGGGAVVYGSGTRGGVVNIVTKAPSKDFTRVVLKATSGEEEGLQGGSLSLATGKRISPSLFIRADLSGGYTPGTRNAASQDKQTKAFSNDHTTNTYAAFQTLYTPNESSKLDFNISYSHLWRSYPRTYFTLATGSGTTASPYVEKSLSQLRSERNYAHADTYKTETDALQSSLNYTQNFSESLDFDALAFYQFSLLKYTKDSHTTATLQNNGSNGKAGFQNHGGGLNLKLRHKTEKNTFIVGLDNVLEYSKRRNLTDHILNLSFNIQQNAQSIVYAYAADVDNTALKLSNSLYAYDRYNFNDSFDLSGGVRVEYSNYWTDNNQAFDSLGTCTGTMCTVLMRSFPTLDQSEKFDLHKERLGYAAELTPNYKYSDTGNIYAKAELGFISPSAYQMINADPSSSANSGRPSGGIFLNEENGVKPEQYLTGELGWRDSLGGSYLSATLFYTHTFDEIFVNSISHGTAYTYSNLGETQRAGVELIAAQELFESEWLRLSESVAYLYTNILKSNTANATLKGNNVPYVPSLKATLNIEADVFRSENQFLSVFLNNAYFSKSIDSTARTMNKNGYVLSDLGLMYGVSDFKVNVGVRNLFDSWYSTYQVYPNYYAGFGRSYYAELRYSF
ncbi:hemin uptake system outer membrane receptor [Helicobacter marmotae]|uniref:Hemin uptake system outer membrane receptor n=1 Tax=Helicobacter marmotae TaxID=152490 RepID=A0A3D8I552_9HELI|nr:TonB-dependent receptor [Helicobacter marmotae]RDU59894.1 hemin uptake system outer membrane receptor [Helicobacter marmotae]